MLNFLHSPLAQHFTLWLLLFRSSVFHYHPKCAQIYAYWVSDAVKPFNQSPLLWPSILPSNRVFSNETALHIRWPKYWSFTSASVLPKNSQGWPCLGLTGLNSFLAVQGTLKSLQYHNSKASILQCSVLFMIHDPTLTSVHDYWKAIDLSIWIFVGKVISLVFNTLSRFVTVFLPRSKSLLISWLQSLSSDSGTQKSKICFTFLHFTFTFSSI